MGTVNHQDLASEKAGGKVWILYVHVGWIRTGEQRADILLGVQLFKTGAAKGIDAPGTGTWFLVCGQAAGVGAYFFRGNQHFYLPFVQAQSTALNAEDGRFAVEGRFVPRADLGEGASVVTGTQNR